MSTNCMLLGTAKFFYLASILQTSSADECFGWCSSHKQTWEEKCTWRKFCASCPQCIEARRWNIFKPAEMAQVRRLQEVENEQEKSTVATTTAAIDDSIKANALRPNAYLRSASSIAATSSGVAASSSKLVGTPPKPRKRQNETMAKVTTRKADKIFAFTNLADETMWSIIAIFCGTLVMIIAAIVACMYLVQAIRKWRSQDAPKEIEVGAIVP